MSKQCCVELTFKGLFLGKGLKSVSEEVDNMVLDILSPYSSEVSSGSMFPLAILPSCEQMARDLKKE